MLEKRLIVCLDVKDGRTTKGIRFKDNVDVGDPVAMARSYYEQGVDELVFYDITASAERRSIRIDTVRRVGENVFIPFSVGGGISTVEEMREVLLAGAEKVSESDAERLAHRPVSARERDKPEVRGAPTGYMVNIREVRLAAGTEFIVMICGDVMTMPGLPKVPSAEKIDLTDDGKVVGLF